MSNSGDEILVVYTSNFQIRVRKFRHFITYYAWSNDLLLRNQDNQHVDIMLVTHVSSVDFSMYEIEDGDEIAEAERKKD